MQRQQLQPRDEAASVGGLITTLAPHSDSTHAAGVATSMSFRVTTRTTRKTVVFRHPFTLKGVDRTLPPGEYHQTVTDEEMIEGLSFPVYRRISTMILVPAQSHSLFDQDGDDRSSRFASGAATRRRNA